MIYENGWPVHPDRVIRESFVPEVPRLRTIGDIEVCITPALFDALTNWKIRFNSQYGKTGRHRKV